MRKLRAAAVPLLILSGLVLFASLDVTLDAVAHFAFIWDVLLGALLGAAFALLPQLAGFGGKRNVLTAMCWVGGFCAMMLIFFQYISLITDFRVHSMAFLAAPGPRARIVEGAALGFFSFVAGRGSL